MKCAPLTAGIAIAMSLFTTSAWAADHRVEMLNKDSEGRIMQFEPSFLGHWH